MLKLQLTALIYGTLAMIIFIFPYFAYAKEFYEDNGAAQRGDYFQIVGKVIGLHLAIVFFAIVFTSIADIMMASRREFAPSAALELFFQTNSSWVDLIRNMVSFRTNESGASAAQQSSVLAYQVIINYYGVMVAFIMTAIPLIVLSITMSLSMKPQQGGQQESKVSDKIFMTAITFFFITFLVWFHAMLASTFVTIFTRVNFSFYQIMSNFWNMILFQ